MGAWNFPSLREDDHLSLLSSELKRLDISIAALFEVRRPDCSEIMAGGYTYYWSGRSDGCHAQGVAVAQTTAETGDHPLLGMGHSMHPPEGTASGKPRRLPTR